MGLYKNFNNFKGQEINNKELKNEKNEIYSLGDVKKGQNKYLSFLRHMSPAILIAVSSIGAAAYAGFFDKQKEKLEGKILILLDEKEGLESEKENLKQDINKFKRDSINVREDYAVFVKSSSDEKDSLNIVNKGLNIANINLSNKNVRLLNTNQKSRGELDNLTLNILSTKAQFKIAQDSLVSQKKYFNELGIEVRNLELDKRRLRDELNDLDYRWTLIHDSGQEDYLKLKKERDSFYKRLRWYEKKYGNEN